MRYTLDDSGDYDVVTVGSSMTALIAGAILANESAVWACPL